jgi:hypothetical protein
MNRNAKKWIVSAWEYANEIDSFHPWNKIQSQLLVLQSCAATPHEHEEYYFLVCLSGARAVMCLNAEKQAQGGKQ